MGNFKDKLKEESGKIKSSKLLPGVKKILLKAARSNEDCVTIDKDLYDDQVVTWLRSEGIYVEEYRDSRDGDYIKVHLPV